jgi:NhaP-type Na+/H+ or K+/H+ antiporter
MGPVPLSTDQTLLGLGLVVVLALACQLVSGRLRLPAIVLLLPVGFGAGAATEVLHPAALLGNAYQPLVSLGVGVILFEAGLRLRLDELRGDSRPVVQRLVIVGPLVTAVGVTFAVTQLFGLNWGVSVVLGAILVVSGPTVVLPLLAFVRPTDRLRSVLKWEGVLIDPIGALLGVLAFQVVRSSPPGTLSFQPGEFALSIGVGLVIGAIGAAVLWLLLRGLQRSAPSQAVAATLMVVVGALVTADMIREDSGFLAATVMGIVLANQTQLDLSRVLEFQGAVVGLLIAILFVLISASVEPSQVWRLLPAGLALIAVMVLVLRPLTVVLCTWRSKLDGAERAFMAWLAPRGIVAAATASAFGLQLTQAGVAGAADILPIAFLATFGTVVLYGLTAAPVARLFGVAGAGEGVVLVVGGNAWAREIALALESAGQRVRLWTGRSEEQAVAREAGLQAGNARLGVDLVSREAELEEITDALLMTESDDFNALAAFELRHELGRDHVYRLPAQGELLDLVPRYAEGCILFGEEFTFAELTRRFGAGARLVKMPSAQDGLTPLFLLRGGRLIVVTAGLRADPAKGDTMICLAAPSPEADQARRAVPDVHRGDVHGHDSG